jgi:spermidine synthase
MQPTWRSLFRGRPRPKTLYKGRSPFQRIEIVELSRYGKCLRLDRTHQSSELAEFIYHEAIVHPALCLHDNPRRVLIIGGGEGATLREALRHGSVERAVMVDIDEMVVEACRTYLGWDQGAYDDPRAELVIDDGVAFVEKTNDDFDVIIIDSTGPMPGSIAKDLYSEAFFQAAAARLSDGGILAKYVSGPDLMRARVHLEVRQRLRRHFAQVESYVAWTPYYPEHFAFTLAVKGKTVSVFDADRIAARVRPIEDKLRYYDAVTHQHMFGLPKFLREALAQADEL